jgi:hypothetical protein
LMAWRYWARGVQHSGLIRSGPGIRGILGLGCASSRVGSSGLRLSTLRLTSLGLMVEWELSALSCLPYSGAAHRVIVACRNSALSAWPRSGLRRLVRLVGQVLVPDLDWSVAVSADLAGVLAGVWCSWVRCRLVCLAAFTLAGSWHFRGSRDRRYRDCGASPGYCATAGVLEAVL